MDYSKYQVLEFRRQFFKIFGATISIYEPAGNALVGYIKMAAFRLRRDIRVFTDATMQHELVRIGGRRVVSFKPMYDVFDSHTGQQLMTLRFRMLKTYTARGHIDLLDTQGNPYGYVQETSSQLAIVRRWIGVIPVVGPFAELALAFVPQTFDIAYAPNGATPQLAGKIMHRKNPVIVKMSLDTTQAQARLDPRVSIAVCSLLSILDANKNA